MNSSLSIFYFRNSWMMTTTKIASRFLELESRESFYFINNIKLNEDIKEITADISYKKEIIKNLNIDDLFNKVNILLIREPISKFYSGLLQNIQSEYFEYEFNYKKSNFDRIDGYFFNFDFKNINMDIFLNPIMNFNGEILTSELFTRENINDLWKSEFQKFIVEYINHLVNINAFEEYVINDIHTSPYLYLYDFINQKYGPFLIKDIKTSDVIKTSKKFDSLKYFKGESIFEFEKCIKNIDIYKKEINLYKKLSNTNTT